MHYTCITGSKRQRDAHSASPSTPLEVSSLPSDTTDDELEELYEPPPSKKGKRAKGAVTYNCM